MKIEQTETAIAAYYAKDRTPARTLVARAIVDATRAGRKSTIRTVAMQTGIGDHRVSGRLNEIKKAGGHIVDGTWYELHRAGQIKNPGSHVTVEAWTMVARMTRKTEQLSFSL